MAKKSNKVLLGPDGNPIQMQSLTGMLNSGIRDQYITNLYSDAFLNPDAVGITQFEKMYYMDDTCSAGIDFLILSTLAVLGEYTHPKKEVNNFVNEQFERLPGRLLWLAQGLLSALWAGYSVAEKQIVDEDGKWQIGDVQPLHPATITFTVNKSGLRKNRVGGVIINEYGIPTDLGEPISANKLMIWSYQMQFMNPYGRSKLLAAFPLYYFKKHAFSDWARAINKFAAPTAIGEVEQSNALIKDAAGNQMTRVTYMQRIIETLQNKTGVVLTEGMKLTLEQLVRGVSEDFERSMEYCNKMIFRALLLPSLVADAGKVGAYALGQKHYDLLSLVVEEIVRDLSEVILDQFVYPLVLWNFGEQEEWGEFQQRQVEPENAKILSEVFLSMVNSGFLSSERYSDMEYVRESIGVPGISKAEFDKEMQQREQAKKEAAERLRKASENDAEGEDMSEGKEKAPDSKSHDEKDKKKTDEKAYSMVQRALLNGLPSHFVEV